VYKIGNKVIGTAGNIPWTFTCDFKPYAGQDVPITIEAYSKSGNLMICKTITCAVGSVNVSLAGKELDLNGQAALANNQTYLPVRSLVEKAGGTISWDSASQSFTINKGGHSLKLTIGSNKIYKDGAQVPIDTAPFIKNGRSYLPLRYICEELLGYKVNWIKDSLTVDLK
jgi:hypothetical protein